MNLRQAAEMALEAFEDIFGKEKIRCCCNQRCTTTSTRPAAIEKGTKAWADDPRTAGYARLQNRPIQSTTWV
jgi:hypothetical protein